MVLLYPASLDGGDVVLLGVENALPSCHGVKALSKLLDGQRICRACFAKHAAVSCARCGAVREPATRDAAGQPLCPNCLIRDPVNLEVCVGCRRRMCVYSRDRALCHRLDAIDAPRLDRCRPSCANIARTDRHAEQLLQHARALEKQAASEVLPGPLADRLARRAGQLRELSNRHDQDRKHLQEPHA